LTCGCMSTLEAIQIKTEFYPAGTIPKKYEQGDEGGSFIILNLEGWPANSKISLVEERLTNPKKSKCSEMRTQKGMSTLHGISSKGYVPGEPVKFTFKDSKHRLNEEITIIPNPIYVVSAADNARIEAKLSELSPVIYNIVFEGFGKDEDLLYKASSYDEHVESKFQCNNNMLVMYMPGVINKTGGIAKLSITRSSGEILALELPWGMEWIKYFLYYDDEGKTQSIINDKEFLQKNPKIANYFNSQH
jgi:hypothetical protein